MGNNKEPISLKETDYIQKRRGSLFFICMLKDEYGREAKLIFPIRNHGEFIARVFVIGVVGNIQMVGA
jgi:hypothetical protein